MITKKYLADGLLQVAILLSLMKSDLNSWNNLISYPEIHEIVLGSSSAYTQTNFHNGGWNNHLGISHPKNLDSIYNSLFLHDLHSLGEIYRYDQVTTNIAWVGSPGPGGFSQSHESPDVEDPVQEPGAHDSNNNFQASGGSDPVENSAILENAQGPLDSTFPVGDELTKEDMDLIDILWRQDMDLGVGREMFDMNLRLQLEKEREAELQKQQQKEEKLSGDDKQETTPQPDITYIVDNETGEWIPAPPGVTGEPALLINAINNTQANGLNVDDMMRILEEQINGTNLASDGDVTSPENPNLQEQLASLVQNNTSFNNDFEIPASEQFISPVPPVTDGYDAAQFAPASLPVTLPPVVNPEPAPYQPPAEPAADFADQPYVSPTATATGNMEDTLPKSAIALCNNMPQAGIQRSESYEQCLQEVADLFAHYGAPPVGEEPSGDSEGFLFEALPGSQTDLPSVNETLEGEISGALIRNTTLGVASNATDAALLSDPAMTMPPLNSSVDFTPSYNLNNGTNDLLSQMGMATMNGLNGNNLATPLFTPSATNDSADLYMPDPLFVLENFNDVSNSFSQSTAAISQQASIAPPTESPALNMAAFTQTSSSEYTASTDSQISPLSSPSSSAAASSPQTSSGTSHMYTSTSNFIEQLMDNDDAFEEMDFSDGGMDEDLKFTQHALDDASSDSALSSMGSLSSPSQDVNETSNFSDQSSQMDSLEGATGGHELDHKYQKYRSGTYRNFGGYRGRHPRLNSNHSDSGSSSGAFDGFADMRHVKHNHSYPLQPGQQPKERKTSNKLSESSIYVPRDERRIKALKIPFTMEEIIDSSADHFTEMLNRYGLTEPQMQAMKDVRRRGKNKVAAQNCRKRKLDVITTLEEEVEQMRAERDKLVRQRRLIDKDAHETQEKMNQLYQEIFHSLRDDSGQPYDPNEYSLQQSGDGNVFLVPRNATRNAPRQERKKGDKKRKGGKRAK